MSLDDDSLLALYNKELLRLSGAADAPQHLENPDLKARAISPVCGSEVEIELKVSGEKITGFGFEVEACALTKSVLGVMRQVIIGKTREEVSQAGMTLSKMLEGEQVLPEGDWAELKVLEPVKDFKARHNAILLPFEAVEKAFAGRS